MSTSAAECTSECCSAGSSTFFSLNAIGSRFACLHQVKLCLTTREDVMHFNFSLPCSLISSRPLATKRSSSSPGLRPSQIHRPQFSVWNGSIQSEFFTAYTPSAFSNSLICPPNRLLSIIKWRLQRRRRRSMVYMNLDLEGITGCCCICMLHK